MITEKQKQVIKDSIDAVKKDLFSPPELYFKKCLQIANLQRILDLQERKEVFCPLHNKYINNLNLCHLSCAFGHMTECHYPHTCDTDFCKHYKEESEVLSKELGECCYEMKEAIKENFLMIKNEEIVFGNMKNPEKAGNVITGETYNPKEFFYSIKLSYCPWCKTQLISIKKEVIVT